jgi:hypothetical protein
VNAVSAERGDRLILVPGLAPDERLMLSWEEGGLYLDLEGDTAVRCNGIGLRPGERRRLRYGDVLAIGTAHLRIEEGSPPSIEIVHLEGNETIEPAQAARGAAAGSDFGTHEWPDEWIDRTDLPSAVEPEVAAQPNAARKVQGWWWGAVLAVSLLLGVSIFLGQLERVDLKVSPSEVRVSIDGVGWRAGDSLLAWPGNRRVRASLPGFEPVLRDIVIRRGEPLAVDLRRVPSPGILQIDTAGVVATAYVDGAEVGPVPGDLSVREGERTLTLRAEKYLEEVVKLDVKGRGVRQPVAVTLRPSWGALEVSATRQALLEISAKVSTVKSIMAGVVRLLPTLNTLSPEPKSQTRVPTIHCIHPHARDINKPTLISSVLIILCITRSAQDMPRHISRNNAVKIHYTILPAHVMPLPTTTINAQLMHYTTLVAPAMLKHISHNSAVQIRCITRSAWATLWPTLINNAVRIRCITHSALGTTTPTTFNSAQPIPYTIQDAQAMRLRILINNAVRIRCITHSALDTARPMPRSIYWLLLQ